MASLAIASLFLSIFQCHDVKAFWNPVLYGYRDTPDKCVDKVKVIIGLNVWHICTDALLFIVPIAMLWRVQMKFRVKIRVYIVGFVGCLNIAFGIVRIMVAESITTDITCTCFLYPLFPEAKQSLTSQF